MLPKDFNSLDISRPQNLTFVGDQTRQVTCLSDFFELMQGFAKGDGRWWLRGESRQYPQPCLPKFARDYISFDATLPEKDPNSLELAEPEQTDASGQSILVSCLTRQELDVIRDFQKKAPHDDFYERMVGDDENHAGWLIFAQHYEFATRLVDVSSDPLVALFFACQPSGDEPGTVWLYPHPVSMHGAQPPTSIFDAFQPAIRDGQAIAMHEAGQLDKYRSRPVPSRLIEMQFLFDFEAPNRRVLAQRGSFIWSGSPLWHLSRNVFGIEIPAEAKVNILSSLAPFGITQRGLFPT